MKIKKYEASDMKEAIRMIKRDFGNDAVILHSRTVNRGGVFGLFTRELVEVMAGVDINIVENEAEKKPSNFPSALSGIPMLTPKNSDSIPVNRSEMPPVVETAYTPKVIIKEDLSPITTSLEKKVEFLSTEMENLKETLTLIVKKVANSPHPMISPNLLTYYNLMNQIGISEEISISILQDVEAHFKGQELENKESVLSYIRQKVVVMLGNPVPINFDDAHAKKMVALVGPTGVGKTTTIAKMAANFSLIQKKQVALITIDTFRIAAIEQLRNYASIIGIPLEVVFSLEDFTSALRKFKSADIILIDTAGRSPKNNEQILELKKFLKNSFVETHLVLSATAKARDIVTTLKKYEVLGCNKVIFTKVDETDSCGFILDVVSHYGKKLSYFTNGQNVPDDFEVAEGGRLATIMFSNLRE